MVVDFFFVVNSLIFLFHAHVLSHVMTIFGK